MPTVTSQETGRPLPPLFCPSPPCKYRRRLVPSGGYRYQLGRRIATLVYDRAAKLHTSRRAYTALRHPAATLDQRHDTAYQAPRAYPTRLLHKPPHCAARRLARRVSVTHRWDGDPAQMLEMVHAASFLMALCSLRTSCTRRAGTSAHLTTQSASSSGPLTRFPRVRRTGMIS